MRISDWSSDVCSSDLTLVDLKAKRSIEQAWLQSKCGWSPFEGKPITGWPMATVIRGHVAMRDGELLGGPTGRPVRFAGTLGHGEIGRASGRGGVGQAVEVWVGAGTLKKKKKDKKQ